MRLKRSCRVWCVKHRRRMPAARVSATTFLAIYPTLNCG
nr:MAG TPA: hypothetical protein [Caudoviricetes sp.]